MNRQHSTTVSEYPPSDPSAGGHPAPPAAVRKGEVLLDDGFVLYELKKVAFVRGGEHSSDPLVDGFQEGG